MTNTSTVSQLLRKSCAQHLTYACTFVDWRNIVVLLLQELNRRLREEQDSEYQRSLLADQEREQKRAADREAEQAIQRAAQEAQDAER